MLKIIQLPDTLSNKIAAGEVVERPASVVKELVENSIDANCTWIKIDLLEAGLQRIKITDDGDGMSREDCERAFLRHATSKIRNEIDLFHVKTLGFRGEALPSIASVSRLTIKTSEGNHAGMEIVLEGGKVDEAKKSDARKGTEITVEDLFFNTPARLKYMKTIHTELGHVTDVLNRMAFSHPGIRIEATHNGKTLFKTPGTGDLLQVIANVYGIGVARKMLPVSHQTLDFEIEGYISKPEVTRASRSFITTIINGRYVKSIPLNQAIIKAYHTLLPIHRTPIVVLSIKMDPILVDVNVHPAKLEVRFSKEKELFTALEKVIQSKFRQTTLIPKIEQEKKYKIQPSVQHEIQFHSFEKEEAEQADRSTSNFVFEQRPAIERQQDETDDLKGLFTKANEKHLSEVALKNELTHPSEEVKPRVPMMYPIGQLQGTYILAQNEEGFYMIDQHAAQERIKYEFFKTKLGKTVNDSQELLIPITFEFSKQELFIIESNKEELERVGLFFESFGNQAYIIRSHPTWFPKGFEEEIIREMIDQIIQTEKINLEELREEAAILMACKRSIKANHYLNEKDMFKLLEDLRETVDPFTCPHGRPIIIHFSTYELEKMFKRVM